MNHAAAFHPTHLANEFVRLSLLSSGDFESLYTVASDPLIWEQHPQQDRYKREVFQSFFDGALASGAFLIVDAQTNELMGSTRYYDIDLAQSSAAIGYTFMARKYWGGMYNRSAKTLLLNHAFQWVDTVYFHIGSTNRRSQQAVLKLGAQKVGEVQRPQYGASSLHFEYAIQKADWLAKG